MSDEVYLYALEYPHGYVKVGQSKTPDAIESSPAATAHPAREFCKPASGLDTTAVGGGVA